MLSKPDMGFVLMITAFSFIGSEGSLAFGSPTNCNADPEVTSFLKDVSVPSASAPRTPTTPWSPHTDLVLADLAMPSPPTNSRGEEEDSAGASQVARLLSSVRFDFGCLGLTHLGSAMHRSSRHSISVTTACSDKRTDTTVQSLHRGRNAGGSHQALVRKRQ